MPSATLTPNVTCKNSSLKAIEEFRPFEHKPPYSLLGTLQIYAVLSYTTTWCQYIGFAA